MEETEAELARLQQQVAELQRAVAERDGRIAVLEMWARESGYLPRDPAHRHRRQLIESPAEGSA